MRGNDVAQGTCSIEGCNNPLKTRGWCNTHYNRWHKYGDPGEAFVPRTFTERMWAKFQRDENGCWLWTGCIMATGYGQVNLGGRSAGLSVAHRAMYELIVGPVPPGLDLDHLCRVRHCVNPSHLEPVTRRVNLLRGETVTAANAAKTHCPQGHAYDEANTIRYEGKRQCRICGNDRRRESYVLKAHRS